MCARVRVCVRACVRVCVRVCMRVCVRVCVRARGVRVCVCVVVADFHTLFPVIKLTSTARSLGLA